MHTKLLIILALAVCLYAAPDSGNETVTESDSTTTTSTTSSTTTISEASSTTATSTPSSTTTTSDPFSTPTTSTPSSTTTTSESSSSTTTSTPASTSTTSTPSSTTTTSEPSSTSTTSTPSSTSTTSTPSSTTTTSESSSSTTTSTPASTSTTSTPSSTTTTSDPSSTSTSSTSSSTTTTSESPTTTTTSTPSTTTVTSTPSSTTTATSRGPPRPSRPLDRPQFPGLPAIPRPSRPLDRPQLPGLPAIPRPSMPLDFPQLPGYPGRPTIPKPLPIMNMANQGLTIADNIAKELINHVLPSVQPPNRGGPRSRLPRALAAFDVSDPMQIMKLSGSLNLPRLPSRSNIQIPDMDAIVQAMPESLSNSSDIEIPKISTFDTVPPIPGLEDSLNEAREMVIDDIGSEGDMADAIQSGMQNALASDNPTEAMTDLFSRVLDVYRFIAQKCPLIIAKQYVIAEALHCFRDMISIVRSLTLNIEHNH